MLMDEPGGGWGWGLGWRWEEEKEMVVVEGEEVVGWGVAVQPPEQSSVYFEDAGVS